MEFNDFYKELKNFNISQENKRYKSFDMKKKTKKNILEIENSLNAQKVQLIKSKENQYSIFNNINILLQKKTINNKVNKYILKEKEDLKNEIDNIKNKISELYMNTQELNNEAQNLKQDVSEIKLKNIYLSNQIDKYIDDKKYLCRSLLNIENEINKLYIINKINHNKELITTKQIHKCIQKYKN